MKRSLFASKGKLVRGWFVLGLLSVLAATAQESEPLREGYPNFDRRSPAVTAAETVSAATAAPTGGEITAARAVAEAALRGQVRGVRIHRDALLGTPAFVGSTDAFLTGPVGAESPATLAALGTLPVDDPHRRIKAFVDEHAGLFGHESTVLTAARVKRDFVTPHNGLRSTIWEQHIDGVRVFEATFQAHVTRRGELVGAGSTMLSDPAAASRRGKSLSQISGPAPVLSARAAVALAAQDIGETLATEEVTELGVPDGADSRQRFVAPSLTDADVRKVWLPMDGSTLRLCWEVICTGRTRSLMYRILVDAETGEIQIRHNLTADVGPATYRVFTSDSPTPFSPGHATPSTAQPPTVERTLVTLSALNLTASPNGWINDGVFETRGNNVDAHTDTNADNVADLPRPQATGPDRVFDPPLDLTQAPSTYRDAAVVDLFYWCNWMHDKLYELGFTEAAGNFQNDNFGRGGEGNDAVQADAQDGSGTNNANFSTPPDGSPGRMQMYVFSGPTPDRDGDFDHEIVLHEYAHGLSNRLVGGGVGISALVPRGMGEGWSDFYGLALLSNAGDDVDGNYASGGYATYQFGSVTQNYYYGIRRYPYSTDMTKNPLTFRDIDPVQASTHAGVPRSSAIGSTANEVHNMGEVWCVTLWEARANLIKKHGFAIGNQLILQLVTDGMKLAPANPNFLQARDAILQADRVATGGANRAELWAAFSKRGMGFSAFAPASSTTTGLIENFDLPDDLEITPIPPVVITGQVGGPFAPATANFTVSNNGAAALTWSAAKNSSWLDLSSGGGTLAPGASITVTASLNATANSLVDGVYPVPIVFTNLGNGFAQTRTVRLEIEPVSTPIFTETFESGTLDVARWTVTGTATFRTQITTANGPHGGTRHLTMDSSSSTSNFSRNEATLTLNLAGEQGVRLAFWAKAFGDEPNGPPASPFVGGADFDGVAISADGTNWYEVQPLRTSATPAISGSWSKFVVDLDPFLAARGLSFNGSFKIRFNQYDDLPISTDGIAIDDIQVLRIVGAAAPTISVPPASVTASLGGTVTLAVTATSVPAPTYQWNFNGLPIDDATASQLTLSNLKLADAGSYTVTVRNSLGSITSSAAVLSGTATVPTITSHPAGLVGAAGQGASLTVSATGAAPLSYQWRRNGVPIGGATGATLALTGLSRTDADVYDVLVGAGLSVVASQPARLAVTPVSYPGGVAPDSAWDLRPESSGGTGYVVAPLTAERAYLAGSFVSIDGNRRTGVALVGADGKVDATFVPPEFDNAIRALAVQSDGKVVVGGDFVRVNGVLRNRLVRLNSDGSLDPTFNPGTAANSTVLALVIQPDGRVLVGGSFTAFAGSLRDFLVRLNADGSIDTGFLTRGMSSTVNVLALQGDGKIAIGGTFTTGYKDINGNFTTRSRLARINADGTLDTAYNPAPNGTVNALALQTDGKLVVGGLFTSAAATTVGNIVRLNSDGSADMAFTTATGTGFNSTVSALTLLVNGQILAGGSFTSHNGVTVNRFARLTSNGARDAGFLTLGFTSTVNAIGVLPSQRMIVGGLFSSFLNPSNAATTRLRFAKLNPDGSLDTAGNYAIRSPGSINSVLPLPGGKLLITGFFTTLRGITVPTAVAQILPNGTVDSTFNNGGSGANSNVYSAITQPDGKIIITGFLTSYNGVTANGIARLNADGTLDPTFDAGAGLGGSAGYTLALLPGGRVFVGGVFTTVNGVARNRVAVLTGSGDLDTTFNPGTGASSSVYCSTVQTDGKIVIGGAFTTYNGLAANFLARLNGNGTQDSTFTIGTGPTSNITAVAVQNDGKVVIGGFFGAFNGTTRNGVARLSAAGVLDTTFAPLSVLSVYGLLVQEDGKVIVHGSFPAAGAESGTAFLARLNANGTRDTAFAAAGFSSWTGIPPGTLVMGDAGQLFMPSNGYAPLTVSRAVTLPVISTPPVGQIVTTGGTATFSVTATSEFPATYQWRLGTTVLTGATNASYTVTNAQSANAGDYSVVVTSELGSTTSPAASLVVGLSRGMLVGNVRTDSGAGGVALTGAFSVEGTLAKLMLIRAVGPTLVNFSEPGRLADPLLTIVNAATGAIVAVNDDWGSVTNAAQVSTVTASLGAFPLLAGGKDAAVFASFPPGTYQARVSGAAGSTGTVQLEIYDADTTPRLTYVATRAYVAAAGGTVVQGLNLAGLAGGRSYLVRALGPSLGIPGALADPQLSVYLSNNTTPLATNDNWSGDTALANLAASVGAMPLPPTSKDAALAFSATTTGSYTAQVSGVGGAAGIVLLEVFEADSLRAATIPAAIVSHPTPVFVAPGQTARFGVVAVGKPAPTFLWRRNSTPIPTATGANLEIANAQVADVGTYDVVVTNGGGSATSLGAALTVNASAATHAVVAPGFVAGRNIEISNTLSYAGTPGGLAWSVTLPPGWSFVADNGTSAGVKPAAGATGTLRWEWTLVPAGPLTFSYTMKSPANETVDRSLTASAQIGLTGSAPEIIPVDPSPLILRLRIGHSADTDGDLCIGLVELTRVIELYNVRNGTTRTGAYAVAAGASEDGFAIDLARGNGDAVTLARYHSADTNRDGKLNLTELTRVIELYNARAAASRTGAYHAEAGTEDGFAPGP